MKLSTFVTIILIISGVFFAYAQITKEINTQYPDSSLNSSEWEDKYDYIEDVNETFAPLESSLKKIQDEDAGWFSKLAEGITALPYAILIVPQAVFGSLVFGGEIATGFLTIWAIPSAIITLGLVLILVWAIFKLVEYFNKYEV